MLCFWEDLIDNYILILTCFNINIVFWEDLINNNILIQHNKIEFINMEYIPNVRICNEVFKSDKIFRGLASFIIISVIVLSIVSVIYGYTLLMLFNTVLYGVLIACGCKIGYANCQSRIRNTQQHLQNIIRE